MKIIDKTKSSAIIIYNFLKKVLWQFYDKACLRLIYEKLIPPDESKIIRRPSSLLLWICGIYCIFYGITAIRYEIRINRIENQANFVVSQLSSAKYKNALSMIPGVQNTKCLYEPNIWKPCSIFKSWMESKDTLNKGVVQRLKLTLVYWKDSLSQNDLTGVHLEKAVLNNANFENTNLWYANFEYADCSFANFKNANCRYTNFKNTDCNGTNFIKAYIKNANFENAICFNTYFEDANLEGAYFKNADLWYAHFKNADLSFANLINANLSFAIFENANLEGAYFKNIKLVPFWVKTLETKEDIVKFIKELIKAKCVIGIKLDDNILVIIKKEFPELYKRIYPNSKN